MASLQKKTVKGIDYYSIVESRRVNGKPNPIVIDYIGNKEKLYERLTQNPLESATVKSLQHGETHALLSIASLLEITETLDRTFGKHELRECKVSRGMTLLLAAVQRACAPDSKSAFANWYASTTLEAETGIKGDIMTSQLFWEQMNGVTQKDLETAEDEINMRILSRYDITLERLALDYTNYYSFIATGNESSTLAQRGRNKQKRSDLRQYSLAVVTPPKLCIPLVTHVYPGNRCDITEFEKYTKIIKERLNTFDPEKLTLVFDEGSVSKENLSGLDSHFICSFSMSYCKDLYEIENRDYCPLNVGGKIVRTYFQTRNVWDMDLRCIVRLSDELLIGQMRELDRDTTDTKTALDRLGERLRNTRSRIDRSPEAVRENIKKTLTKGHLKDFIEVGISIKDGISIGVSYQIDNEKRERVIEKYFGKSLIVTDHLDWTSEDILAAYGEQDNIEKIFRSSKDNAHCALQPIYHWTDQKVRVHVFICMLAITLVRVLHKEMTTRGAVVSCDKMLDELAKVRKSWILLKDSKSVNGVRVETFIEKMEPLTEELWNILDDIVGYT
jgi:transposase